MFGKRGQAQLPKHSVGQPHHAELDDLYVPSRYGQRAMLRAESALGVLPPYEKAESLRPPTAFRSAHRYPRMQRPLFGMSGLCPRG
jgi:hypothetical protein